jgi:hypothetical protein
MSIEAAANAIIHSSLTASAATEGTAELTLTRSWKTLIGSHFRGCHVVRRS